jgi:uncharacterized repeat protein (TIGR01451 family)
MKAVNILRASLVAGLALGGMSPAFALTAAGSTVTNTASVDYSVGGINQADVNSNSASFTVDRVINVTVTANNSPLDVVPGATGSVLSFTVTNQSNDTLDFALSVLETANSTVLGVGTDGLDMASFSYFVDSNGNGVYDAGVDTATSINDLASSDSVVVFAVADAPTGTTLDGLYAGVAVIATARNGDGSAITGVLTATDANTSGMDTVYGDAAGVTGDGVKDGSGSAYGAYKMATAKLDFSKTATIISDPVNLTSNPKAIPGAVIEYCLVISNTGSATADSIVLTDHIPADTTYVAGSLRTGMGGDSSTCAASGGSTRTDAADADIASATTSGGTFGNGTVSMQVGTLAAPTGVFRGVFRVTVD